MQAMTTVDVAHRFVDRINAKDVNGIVALMTEDHRFIDSLGVEVVGRENMRRGWEGYLRMVPDYHIEVQETLAEGETVVLLGTARGTYSRDGTLRAEDAWVTPAAWRTRIKGNHVAEWQVYADNEPIRRRMSSTSA